MKTKIKQPDAKIVASLEALKAELLKRDYDADGTLREILFKINSCLFDQYPTHPREVA